MHVGCRHVEKIAKEFSPVSQALLDLVLLESVASPKLAAILLLQPFLSKARPAELHCSLQHLLCAVPRFPCQIQK